MARMDDLRAAPLVIDDTQTGGGTREAIVDMPAGMLKFDVAIDPAPFVADPLLQMTVSADVSYDGGATWVQGPSARFSSAGVVGQVNSRRQNRDMIYVGFDLK